ncbi:MAG TPA: polyprenyl diphosphate synthase [Candidatus Nanoarchaeia archaeon]|nr:polyprenyl diphosphate synthase [Candidatus Nanoarchaeia archaeon]
MIPPHIAVILDGNRRYAKKRFGNPLIGHYYGGKKVGELIKWCMEAGVKELTLYCFSVENFKRDEKEVAYLFNLFRDNLKKYKDDGKLKKRGIRINFIGRLQMFPKDMQRGMKGVMEATKSNNKFTINFALAYGGRDEIVDAVKSIARKKVPPEEIDEAIIERHLYLKSKPDLLIRTGEMRISNFLLWQTAYSELIFLPNVLWPEFSKSDFKRCMGEFSRRERRFGR